MKKIVLGVLLTVATLLVGANVATAQTAPLKLVTPAGGTRLQLGNAHNIYWTPNTATNIQAFLETKKDGVFNKVARIIPCNWTFTGVIKWCGDVDPTPNDQVSEKVQANLGSYYLSLINNDNQQVVRTSSPIKVVEYGDVLKLKFKAHLDKTKRLVANKSGDTPLTIEDRSLTVSWSSQADSCDVRVVSRGPSDYPQYEMVKEDLSRHVTKMELALPEKYDIGDIHDEYPRLNDYRVVLTCFKGTNIQQQAFLVTIEDESATPKIGAPEVTFVDATSDLANSGTIGRYAMDISVRASGGDLKILPQAVWGFTGTSTAGFTAIFTNQDQWAIGGASFFSVSSSKEPNSSGVIEIKQDETVNFTINGRHQPDYGGSYKLVLVGIRYATADGQEHDYLVKEGDFWTYSVDLIGTKGDASQFSLVSNLAADAVGYGPYSAMAALPDLRLGDTHAGVASIQRFLNANGFPISAAAGQPGSVGYESTYFGAATQRALAAYQASKGISATGTFGPMTRTAMASTSN